MALKTWLAIPIMAIACTAVAFAARVSIEAAFALAALGAALAAAVRAFAGPSLAAAVAGGAAALLGVLALCDVPGIALVRAALAAAAAIFAIGELTRPLPPTASPLPALGAALVAGVLDASFVGLFAIAGVRYVRGPWPQPRGVIALPIVGVLAIVLAAIAALLRDGLCSELWVAWTGRTPTSTHPLEVLEKAGDLLGPITAVTALAGLAVCAVRSRFAAASVAAVTVGALAVDLATGTVGSATAVVAALAAGVGVARLTAMVHWPAGQAFIGATAGFMMVVAPAWALAVR